MNNPLHHLEKLKDNLVKTIADLETMFRIPVLLIDESKIPDIDAFIEEWKKHSGKILTLPAESYEFSHKIEDKYQEMIDMYREHLKFVNQEIRKHNKLI